MKRLRGIELFDGTSSVSWAQIRDQVAAVKAVVYKAKVNASLWVDIVTGWPVEITMDITDENGNEQMAIVVSDFQWDTQIDPATFASIIPEGYTLMYKVDAEHLEEGNQLIDG